MLDILSLAEVQFNICHHKMSMCLEPNRKSKEAARQDTRIIRNVTKVPQKNHLSIKKKQVLHSCCGSLIHKASIANVKNSTFA